MNKTYAIKSAEAVVALVNAPTKTAALRHVAEMYFTADLATVADGVAAAKAGMEIEEAGAKPAAEPAADPAQAAEPAAQTSGGVAP